MEATIGVYAKYLTEYGGQSKYHISSTELWPKWLWLRAEVTYMSKKRNFLISWILGTNSIQTSLSKAHVDWLHWLLYKGDRKLKPLLTFDVSWLTTFNCTRGRVLVKVFGWGVRPNTETCTLFQTKDLWFAIPYFRRAKIDIPFQTSKNLLHDSNIWPQLTRNGFHWRKPFEKGFKFANVDAEVNSFL